MLLLDVVKETSKTLPEFNMDWILNQRKRKFNKIIETLENSIREAISLLDKYDFKYNGHYILSPEERIEIFNSANKKTAQGFIEDKKIRENKYFEVHRNSLLSVRLEFSFQNTKIYSLINIPFLKDHKISYAGVDYYPELPIVEKCIHINFKSGLMTIKVARAPLKFWRSEEFKFFDVTKKRVFKEIVVTTKIHQGGIKKKRNAPIILYYLVKGWFYTLDKLGFDREEMKLTEEYDEKDENNFYFPIFVKDGDQHVRTIYFKILKTSFEDLNKRRFVACILRELTHFNRRFNISDLEDPEGVLWMLILGQYIYVNKDLIIYPSVVVDHVREHLITNASLVDGVTRKAFRSLGLNINDFDDLLYNIYYKIDEWYINFIPSNLYEKRITFNPMFSGFERKLYSDIFKIIKKIKQKKRNMELSDASAFKFSKAYKPTWFNDHRGFFSTNPPKFNSNMSDILLHRFILTDSDESGSKKKGKQAPREIQLAHPSVLTVTSVTTVPSATPIISGSINPYISTDEEDNIVVDEELKKYVSKCFKR